jgi:integrase
MLYTTQQLAALLQIHPESVRRMTRQGRLPTPIKLSATKAGDVRYLKTRPQGGGLMATIRRVEWSSGPGKNAGSAWQVNYTDQNGKRHKKNFGLKKDADAWRLKMETEVKTGTHTPEAGSETIAERAELYLKTKKLELRTQRHYRQMLRLYILPAIGNKTLATLGGRDVRKFNDDLVISSVKGYYRREMVNLLFAIIEKAQQDGFEGKNAAANIEIDLEDKPTMTAGVHFPTPEEVNRILSNVPEWWRVYYHMAAFTGMRPEELRALPWRDIDFEEAVVHVRQAADEDRTIKLPKSKAGQRTIDLGPRMLQMLWDLKHTPRALRQRQHLDPELDRLILAVGDNAPSRYKMSAITAAIGEPGFDKTRPGNVNGYTKKAWAAYMRYKRLKAPQRVNMRGKRAHDPNFIYYAKTGPDDLVFPSQEGTMAFDSQPHKHGWKPALRKAGLVDDAGKGKYRPYDLRHFYASLTIRMMVNENRWDPTELQRLMGHAEYQTTLKVYGHLFPRDERTKKLAALGEAHVMGILAPRQLFLPAPDDDDLDDAAE